MPRNDEVLRRVADAYHPPEKLATAQRSLGLAIQTLMDTKRIQARHRRQLIDIAIWKYTESTGMTPYPKYNLRFVSDAARDLDVPVSVQHEHVWERRHILNKLFDRSSWAIEELTQFLAEHAVACVVTVEEHALLGHVRGAAGWDRYERAGIPVWDRERGAYLDLRAAQPTATRVLKRPPVPSVIQMWDLDELIDARSARPDLLDRLRRSARFMSATSVPAIKLDHQPANYFRIHDTLLPMPTRAVAYPHWSGKVDFALKRADVPSALLQEACVKELANRSYSISCKVTDDASASLAEELMFLSLEKLRADELS